MDNFRGWIWNDGDKDTEAGVRRAVRRYVEKFGMRPGVVEVNRSRVKDEVVIDGVRVVGVSYLMVNDFWVTG